MATLRQPITGLNLLPESGVFSDKISNQITAAAAPSIGEQFAMVLADGGADEGFYCNFSIPKNYVGSPKLIFRGILDGAPAAGAIVAIGIRKRAVADNESADGVYDAEQIANVVVGSSGSNYSNEDEMELAITLTAANYTIDDTVYYYFFLDSSVMTYVGNLLLTGLLFEYSDA